jgi:hypothetical protein
MKRPRNGLGLYRWIKPGRQRGEAPTMGPPARLHKNAVRRARIDYAGQAPKIIMVAAVIFAAGAITAIILWESRGRGSGRTFSLPVPGAIPAIIKVPTPEIPVMEGIVSSFLAARTPQELEPLIRGSNQRPEDMIAKLQALEDRDGKVQAVRYIKPLDSYCLQLESVLVSFETGHNRIAILSPDAEENWRVDFDAFDRHVTPEWDKLLEGEPVEGTVRVFASADTYYNGRHTEDRWACFAMESPDHDTIIYGYVPRGSRRYAAIASTLRFSLLGTSVPRRRMTLDIRHTGTGDPRQFEITRVLSDEWAIGNQPLEGLISGKFSD